MLRRILRVKKLPLIFVLVIAFVVINLIVAWPMSSDPFERALAEFKGRPGSIEILGIMEEGDRNLPPDDITPPLPGRFVLNDAMRGVIFRYDGVEVWLIHFLTHDDYLSTLNTNYTSVGREDESGNIIYETIGWEIEFASGLRQTFSEMPTLRGSGGTLMLITESQRAINVFNGIRI
ncbi:MAG: hypothetical protein FWB72_02730 [Firmicutes bacterium]|nr:hypothetical protein [Bacillota bacterium]